MRKLNIVPIITIFLILSAAVVLAISQTRSPTSYSASNSTIYHVNWHLFLSFYFSQPFSPRAFSFVNVSF